MPAPGWGAVFNADEGEQYVEPLVGWALVQDADPNMTRIVGLVASDKVDLADTLPDFGGYAHLENIVFNDFDYDDDLDEDDDDDFDDEPPPPPPVPRPPRKTRLN
jgi:hypothetical protein